MKPSAVRRTPAVRRTVLSRALLVALAGFSLPALANDECGAPGAGGQVVCAPDGSGDVPQVHYEGVTDFELVLKPGFNVDGTLQRDPTTAVVLYGDGALKLTAEDGTVIRAHDGWTAVDVASTGSVDVRVDQVFGGNIGVAAVAAGDVDVWANSVEGDIAVEAISLGGNINVDVAHVAGGENGAGVAALTELGDIHIAAGEVFGQGDFTTGVYASSHDGSTSLEAGFIAVDGVGSAGVFAETWQNGDVNLDLGTVTANGEGSASILAGAGLGDINIKAGWVGQTGDFGIGLGVFAFNGSVSLDIGGVFTDGTETRAIDVSALGTVDLASDSVVTMGAGSNAVSIETVGDVTVQSRRIATYGHESYGLNVLTGGNVMIDIDEISTYGELSAALFVGNDAGDITARVGRVHTYATAGDWFAVGLSSNTGDVALLVDELVQADSGFAITTASWEGGVHIAVAEGASVFGQAVAIDSATSTGTRIDIAGTVESLGGPAIQVAGNEVGDGAADIRIGSTGMVRGTLQLSGGDDVVTNAGTFHTQSTSVFGAGDDTFANLGLVALGERDTMITLQGLEQFDNAGVVSLVNGRSGDVFAVDGTLNGAAGGTLAVDLDLAQRTSDMIDVGALAGTNALELDFVGHGSLLGMGGIRVLTTDAAQTGDELVLAGNSQGRGFIGFRLAYDGVDSWLLESDLADAAYFAAAVPAGVRDLWRQGAQVISTHLVATHDNADANGVWVQAVGGEFEGTSNLSHTLGSRELAWEGDHHGLQFGAEMTLGSWRAGVTAGYDDARMDLGGAEHTQLDSVNAGLYAAWSHDGWFTNAVLRADRIDLESDFASIGLQDTGDASAWGVDVEGGRRFAPSRMWIEPFARLAWTDVSLPGQDGVSGTVRWEGGALATGELGLRIGVVDGWHGVRPYASMSIAREFGDGGETVYDLGIDTVHVSDEGDRSFGRFAGGATWTIGNVDLYGEVEGRVGDMEGTGGHLGARVRF